MFYMNHVGHEDDWETDKAKVVVGCAVVACIGLGFGAHEVYKSTRGLVVRPAVVANFNGDQKTDDIVYRWDDTGEKATGTFYYVDGKDVTSDESGHRRHSEGKQVGPTVLKGVPNRVEAADEDGDNNLDLRFTNEQDGGVQVFLGDGKGNFTLPPERGR